MLFCAFAIPADAQIRGVITDANTGTAIAYPTIKYKGKKIGARGNEEGLYSIERRDGWTLVFSCVGYETMTVDINKDIPENLNVKLKPDTKLLSEVVIKQKKGKYSRKNNPAVELMKRVIAAKKKSDLTQHNYYQFQKYQKINLAVNDISAQDIEQGIFGKKTWLINHLEINPFTSKPTLPISIDETVSKYIYRKSPRKDKTIILAQRNTGINEVIETGDILNTVLKDMFTDVDIYDDQVRLFQAYFTSPIGKDAISFYRYYIEDTTMVDKSWCYHLSFTPNNPQDFGFRGDLYILADSTLQVKRCVMTLPKNSGVNFINGLHLEQGFIQLPNGEWVLQDDDLNVELGITKGMRSNFVVTRTTRRTDYRFDPIAAKLFRGKAKERYEANAMMRTDDYWQQNRTVALSKSEDSMGAMIKRLEQSPGFKYLIFVVKAFVENYVETGDTQHPSKVDIGPINTIITHNFIDGLRTRLSAITTANLNKHWFLSGYLARGWKSKKTYYKGELIYSFNKKEYQPHEFPKRTVTLSSSYDIMAPSDRFIPTDKDNVFGSLKWTKVDKMMFYNRQQLAFEYEQEWGMRTLLSLKTEETEAVGSLFFIPISPTAVYPNTEGIDVSTLLHNGKLRTTELRLDLEIAPGRTYINTKQHRRPVNLNAPVFTLSHTMGIKGLLGGQYSYNLTEGGFFKRFWLNSWGKFDVALKAGIQWNKVPYPLLIVPAANLSYLSQPQTFNLINNLEFLNDKYATADLAWDMNGKLLNRIPLLRFLNWREHLTFKTLWGSLSDKNNPLLSQNQNDDTLMLFPNGTTPLNPKVPYMECSFGFYNIFKVLQVEYVRRLNYNQLPTAMKHGIRIKLRLSF